MMILTFRLANNYIRVKIDGHNVTFSNHYSNFINFYPIESLKFSREGILKEHPDLKKLEFGQMKEIAIQRLKEHILNLGGEIEIKNYLVEELNPHGYHLQLIERSGFRPQRI